MKKSNSFFIFIVFISNLCAQDHLEYVQNLYLTLMKKIILNTIYEPADYKETGDEWPANAHSMIGMKRMDNIQFCIENIIKNNIEGDLIETGVWRGGATIFMAAILAAHNITDRNIWVADSFQGLPSPDTEHFPIDSTCPLHTYDYLKVSLEQVQSNFKAYDLLNNQIKFLKGFFKETMPNNSIKKLALLRLDGDMYESTMQVLEALYDKVSIGGYIIIDDYILGWAQKATDDFRAARHIADPLLYIDGRAVFWKKSA